MNTNNYSVLNALVDIIAAPAKALEEVRSRVAWLWVPLVISVVVTVAAFVAYFLWVDFDWLLDEMVRQMPPGTDPAAAEQMRNFMSPGVNITLIAISIPLMTLLIYAVQAVYLHLVNKVAGDPSLRYGQWFAFSAWTAFVGVFQAIAMFVVMLLADSNQVAQHELMPLSFNQLFLHAEPGSSWFNWGNSISLVNVWMLVLMTIGFMRWTGSAAVKSAIIVSAPWVLIFGIWALLIS
ncbi:MAG TPA: YIP1 family protein [Xanthomonadaceae bacterium]|nr:YIP1 family protein [Xanthomonadaceae bacterium]